MFGNCATGKLMIVIVPRITITIEITIATIGRLMKNLDMAFTLPAPSHYPAHMASGLLAHRDAPSALPRPPRVLPASVRPRLSTGRRHDLQPGPSVCCPCSPHPQQPLDKRLATPKPHAAALATHLSALEPLSEFCRSRRDEEYFPDWEIARQSELTRCQHSLADLQNRTSPRASKLSRPLKSIEVEDFCQPLAD